MQSIEIQVYVRNNEEKILKKFQKVSDPRASGYGLYMLLPVIEQKEKEVYFRSLSLLFQGEVRETVFEDVFLVTLPIGKEIPKIFPKWIKRIEQDSHFKETIECIKVKENSSSIRVLPSIPSLSDGLKERLNVECMLWGLQGKTLLADAQSGWGEMPAVTVFTNTPVALFSKIFNRNSHALYQKHFVNTYLWDPDVKPRLREMQFFPQGRAAPDIYVEDLSFFLLFLEKINEKRRQQELPPIGFVNPFFYQNAHAFKRPYTGAPVFPDSFALWSANRGLGIPHYGGLLDAFEALGGRRAKGFKQWVKNLSLFPSTLD